MPSNCSRHPSSCLQLTPPGTPGSGIRGYLAAPLGWPVSFSDFTRPTPAWFYPQMGPAHDSTKVVSILETDIALQSITRTQSLSLIRPWAFSQPPHLSEVSHESQGPAIMLHPQPVPDPSLLPLRPRWLWPCSSLPRSLWWLPSSPPDTNQNVPFKCEFNYISLLS